MKPPEPHALPRPLVPLEVTERPHLFGGPDDLQLTHESEDEYIESYLSSFDLQVGFRLPETVEVCEYANVCVDSEEVATRIVEETLRILDEEYGDPEGDLTKATRDVEQAAVVFAKAILKDYVVWLSEQVGVSAEVDTLEWVTEHRPDWLKNAPDSFRHLMGTRR